MKMVLVAAFSLIASVVASPTTVAFAQETEKLPRIVFAHASASLAILPFYVARERGMFQDAGVDVELARVGAGNFFPALFSGEADAVHSNVVDPMTLRSKGQNAVAVGAFVQNFATQFAFSKKVADELGLQSTSPLEDRIKALRGKTIAVTGQGAGTDQQLRYLLGKYGLDYQRDLTVTFIRDGTADLSALASGQIDGFIHNSPWYQIAISRGDAIMMANFANGDVPGVRGFVQGAIVTTSDILEEKKLGLTRLLAGISKAMTFIHDPENIDEVVAIALENASDGTTTHEQMREYIDVIVETEQIPKTPLLTEEQFQVSLDFNNYLLSLQGTAELDYEYKDIVNTELVTKALGEAN